MSVKEGNQALIDKLFKAGAHFGFQKSRRHPSVKPYIFGTKQGTDIFDLEKAVVLLDEAKSVLNTAGKEGKTVLFVCTKEETSPLVTESAKKADSPYVTNRWIGGILTNWNEIKKRIARLFELTAEGESGELERKYTKKERVIIGREIDKLVYNFGGIKNMERKPDLLLIVDPRHDHIAATEAREMGVKTVGIMSSDTDVKMVDYPIVANDALNTSVTIVLDELVNSYLGGRSEFTPKTERPENKVRGRRV